MTVEDYGGGQTAIDHRLVTEEGDQAGDDDKRPLSFETNAFPVFAPDLESWRRFMLDAGFTELTHYYRPAGLPREQQPWLASVWRRGVER